MPLSAQLADNGAVLLPAYRSIVAAIDEGRAITPASEWLIDNYHLVEKQLRQISTDLPPGYYRQLPKLITGPFVGYPRVFGLAWAFVAHTDSSFDSDILVAYIKAYQEVQPLTIGELWAVSITLQIVLIENLRRLAQQITLSRTVRREADGLADRLLGVGGRAPEPASIVFAGRPAGRLPDAFAVQLVHRLREQDPKFTPALAWLDERLAKQEMTADSAVREVHRSQGAANVTVRNIVTSLRVIVEVDWKELFERYCLVDGALAKRGAFSRMDFATRTLYRSAVEELARGSLHDELDIARLAVAAAGAPHPSLPALEQSRRADSGYYLHSGRTPRIRGVDRLSQISILARARDGQAEFHRLCRIDRRDVLRPFDGPDIRFGQNGRRRRRTHASRPCRGDFRDRRRRGRGQSHRYVVRPRRRAAGACASGRRSGIAAHPSRRADASDHA